MGLPNARPSGARHDGRRGCHRAGAEPEAGLDLTAEADRLSYAEQLREAATLAHSALRADDAAESDVDARINEIPKDKLVIAYCQ